MDNTVFQQLIAAVILAIVSLLAYAARGLLTVGIAYLRTKLSQSNFDMLGSFVKTVVSFLEQSPVFRDLMNEEKKERAIVEITQFCEDHKLPIDHALIDKLIEAAVLQIKKDLAPVTGA